MKYIFIPEKSVFSDAFDPNSKNHKSATEFLDFLAEQRSLKGYSVATIPKSLMIELKSKIFFKSNKTYELIKSFIDVEESITSDNLNEDYFKLAEIKAIGKQPIIVSTITGVEMSKEHSTYIINSEFAVKMMKGFDF